VIGGVIEMSKEYMSVSDVVFEQTNFDNFKESTKIIFSEKLPNWFSNFKSHYLS
jgi:hypothetical protein